MQESNNEINSSKQNNKLKKKFLSLCKNIYGYIKKLFLWSFHKIKESPESLFKYVGRFERTRIFLFLCYALFLLAIYSSANKFLNKNRDELDSRLEKILNMVEINEIANITIDIESILTVTNENIENQKILIDNILSDNLDEIEESINNNMEKQYSLMREYINQVVINNTNTTTFWLAFLSVIMVVFTILGLTINNNVLKQAEKDIAAVKQESEKAILSVKQDSENAIISIKQEADEAIKELIEESEQSIKISNYFNLALQADDSKNYDSAIENYTKLIELDKDNFIAYNNRAIVYSQKDDYDNAIKDIDKAIELEPSNEEYKKTKLLIENIRDENYENYENLDS